MKVKVNGQTVDYDGAVALMDDDLRQTIADKLALRLDDDEERQVFVDEYASAHERVYGAPFIVN